jgi:hypothetical protein
MGSGGINMIVDVIVSDLVPLRERGNYVSGPPRPPPGLSAEMGRG